MYSDSKWNQLDGETMGLIGIYTTNKCNLACKYCFANSKTMEVDSEKVCLFIKQYIRNTSEKYYNLLITGGEPLLYKNLKNMIVELRDEINDIALLTNGILLTNEWMEFIEKEHIILHVSLDSLNKDYHNKYRGGFKTIYDNLGKLRDYNIKVIVCMTMSHDNIDDVEKMISYTSSAGTKLDLNLISLNSDNPLAWENATQTQREKGIIQIKKWIEYTKRTAKGKIMISFIKKGHIIMPVCYNKKHSLIIHTDGQVYPCFTNRRLTYGNINSDSFDYIINRFNKYRTVSSEDCFCLDCLGMYD